MWKVENDCFLFLGKKEIRAKFWWYSKQGVTYLMYFCFFNRYTVESDNLKTHIEFAGDNLLVLETI